MNHPYPYIRHEGDDQVDYISGFVKNRFYRRGMTGSSLIMMSQITFDKYKMKFARIYGFFKNRIDPNYVPLNIHRARDVLASLNRVDLRYSVVCHIKDESRELDLDYIDCISLIRQTNLSVERKEQFAGIFLDWRNSRIHVTDKTTDEIYIYDTIGKIKKYWYSYFIVYLYMLADPNFEIEHYEIGVL